MLRKLCNDKTDLSFHDIEYLEQLCKNLQYTADLTNSDVFIDCKSKNSNDCIVVAHARPAYKFSAYEGNVVGGVAEKEKEPAVFHTFESGVPYRDLKAITQEGCIVKQDVVPVKNSSGNIIAVMIVEKDITSTVSENKKINELKKTAEEYEEKLYGFTSENDFDSSVTVREIHHRIKNNLQMVASMLNIQANRSDSNEVKKALKENINRVLSISSIHDILTNKEINGEISILELIKKIIYNSRKYSFYEDTNFNITLQGDDILLSCDVATSIAIVVNELISNAIIHGFENRESGNIVITVRRGALSSSVTVSDDGCGLKNQGRSKKNVGLKLVQSVVSDKLNGSFNLTSDACGTLAKFDFKNK